MLVLSRKLNEEIIIKGNITVKVVGVKGNQVRFAFSAPPEVSIYRSEIAESIASCHEPDKSVVVPSSHERLAATRTSRLLARKAR